MVEETHVDEGFQSTEVGEIPIDWVVVQIGEICKIHVGRDLREDIFSETEDNTYKYPVFSNTVSNYGLYGFYSNPEYRGDSFTVVGRGVGLGKAFYRSGGYGAIGRLLVLFPIEDVDARYLVQYINLYILISFESSGIPQLTGISFAKYKLPLPPTKAEQTAIATALSDMDALIEGLEQLLVKKRNIKQGAMQELLTGRRRLVGFESLNGVQQTEVGIIPTDWEIDEIQNLCSISTGDKNTQDRIEGGTYPFFVRSQTVERINSYSYDGEAVLTAGDGVGTGKVFHYIYGKFDYHQRVYLMSEFSERLHGYFFYQYFCNNFYDRIIQMTAKSSVDSVRKEMIAKMLIPLPKPTEQAAIAATLRNMDEEIEKLETQLSKYKLLKTGMMQELLTGKKRLI